MAEIIITSYFEDGTGPVLNLSPTIRIWEVSSSGNSLIVGSSCGSGLNVDGSMTEVKDCGSPGSEQDGFYSFVFTDAVGYNSDSTYVIRVDGGFPLSTAFRYQTSSIAPGTVTTKFIEDAVWDAKAADHVGGSPVTMGEIQNDTHTSVETIRLTDIPALYELMNLVRKYNANRTKIDTTNYTLTVYDDDCVTPIRIFRLLDSTGGPSVQEVCERTSINGTVGGSPTGIIGDDGYPVCSTDTP